MQIAQKNRAYIVQLFFKKPLDILYKVCYNIITKGKQQRRQRPRAERTVHTMEEYGYTLEDIEQGEIKPYTAEQRDIIDEMNADIKALAAELGLN